MKSMLLLASLFSLNAFAAVGDITCTGNYQEIGLKDTLANEDVTLTVTQNQGAIFQASAKVHDRQFSVSGNKIEGTFMLFQTWGKDLTEGTSATASFNADGRLQISTLEDIPRGTDGKFAGSILYKLVCQKALK